MVDLLFFFFFLFSRQDGVELEGLISGRTLAASPRLSFFDGENYSQMRGKEGKKSLELERWRRPEERRAD